MATILAFPSSRTFRHVRVERERDGEAWLTLFEACGWLHGDFDAAIRDAHEMALGFGVNVVSSAGRLP
jgi:hypothetical protein